MDFRNYGLMGAQINKKLNDQNIFLMTMSTYFAGTSDIKTFFRVNLACNREVLLRFITRLESTMHNCEQEESFKLEKFNSWYGDQSNME